MFDEQVLGLKEKDTFAIYDNKTLLPIRNGKEAVFLRLQNHLSTKKSPEKLIIECNFIAIYF